ncbi:MAG: dihydrolipoyl dehydrogenase [Thermoguttaceae bacterium]
METQLAVIGAGPGGYAAAFMAADLGMHVTLVDLEPRLGGTCLLRGCIPSKALLHVARTMADAKHLVDWGVSFAEPTIDIETLRTRKEELLQTLTGGLKQIGSRRKVRMIRARASFEDARTLRLTQVGDEPLDDDRIKFDHCIIATGSRPTKIRSLDLPTSRIMDSTVALQLPDVPESLLVVGGGYIGLEMGTVYAALGSRVSVVELTDGLLPGADRDLVRPLQRRLAEQFEAIHLKTKVTAVADKGQAIEVTFKGDVEPNVQQFDRVLVAVGRRPNSDGLGLDATCVEVDNAGFIVTDKRGRTAESSILAVGDVTGEPMLAHRASHQGKVVVEALGGMKTQFDPRAIPAVVFTDPEIAWAGLTETEAKQQGHKVEAARFPWAASGRAQAVGRTEGMTKWIIDPDTDRLLGCGIVGVGAGELIAEAVLAIEMGAEVRDLSDTIHPHPTMSETLGAAAEVHLGTATDLYRPKRTRS